MTDWTTSSTSVAETLGWAVVTEYGAVGDGKTDDTDAIMDAINDAAGGAPSGDPTRLRQARKVVYLPPGRYRITTGLKILAVLGLTIRGAGPRQATICFDGDADDVLAFIGCPTLTLADFRVVGQGGLAGTATAKGSGIALDWTPEQADAWCSGTSIQRVHVEELRCKYGFGFGVNSRNYDVSEILMVDCCVNGGRPVPNDDGAAPDDPHLWQAAYRSGNGVSGNVLDHHYVHCTGGGVRWLYDIASVNTVTVENGNGGHCDAALHYTGSGTITYSGARVEEARRLFTSGGGAGYPVGLVAENVRYAPGSRGAADREVIQWGYSGAVSLRHLTLGDDGTSHPYRFRFNTNGQDRSQVDVLIDGLVTTNPSLESLMVVPSGHRVLIEARAMLQVFNTPGLTGAHIGHKALAYNGAHGVEWPAEMAT